jgi:hypothetical protein
VDVPGFATTMSTLGRRADVTSTISWWTIGFSIDVTAPT